MQEPSLDARVFLNVQTVDALSSKARKGRNEYTTQSTAPNNMPKVGRKMSLTALKSSYTYLAAKISNINQYQCHTRRELPKRAQLSQSYVLVAQSSRGCETLQSRKELPSSTSAMVKSEKNQRESQQITPKYRNKDESTSCDGTR